MLLAGKCKTTHIIKQGMHNWIKKNAKRRDTKGSALSGIFTSLKWQSSTSPLRVRMIWSAWRTLDKKKKKPSKILVKISLSLSQITCCHIFCSEQITPFILLLKKKATKKVFCFKRSSKPHSVQLRGKVKCYDAYLTPGDTFPMVRLCILHESETCTSVCVLLHSAGRCGGMSRPYGSWKLKVSTSLIPLDLMQPAD